MNEVSQRMAEDYLRMTGEPYRFGVKSIITLAYSHQIRFMRIWRKNTFFRQLKLYLYSRKYALEISQKATIGKGLYLGHPYGITVAGG